MSGAVRRRPSKDLPPAYRRALHDASTGPRGRSDGRRRAGPAGQPVCGHPGRRLDQDRVGFPVHKKWTCIRTGMEHSASRQRRLDRAGIGRTCVRRRSYRWKRPELRRSCRRPMCAGRIACRPWGAAGTDNEPLNPRAVFCSGEASWAALFVENRLSEKPSVGETLQEDVCQVRERQRRGDHSQEKKSDC